MIKEIVDIDKNVFQMINSERCDIADWIFSIFSAHWFIGCVVVSFACYLTLNHFKKNWWILIILTGLCFLLSDRISVICFKDVFCRLRPSHALQNVYLCKLQNFHLIFDNKGGLYGFVSSHAANVCCITTLYLFFIKQNIGKIIIVLWAIITCYSRIYCGYHYPLDVVCGAMLGVVNGLLLYFLFQKSHAEKLLNSK
jgi:undecaprenyl-diphosphatase